MKINIFDPGAKAAQPAAESEEKMRKTKNIYKMYAAWEFERERQDLEASCPHTRSG